MPNRRVQFSRNMETIRDRWGIDAHSDVTILTEKLFNSQEDATSFTLNTVNNFIKLYRHFDQEAVHLVPLTEEDLFGLNYETEGEGWYMTNLAGGIRTVDHLLNFEIS